MRAFSKKYYDSIIKSSVKEEEKFKRISALNALNCLNAVKSAEHGWLGASFSVCEILTFLYFFLNEKNIVLSKGHAAPMQYGCLLGKGILSEEQILNYKNGPDFPQAHTDISTKGILINTGSLGQALSKTAGMAFYRPQKKYYVILGDGELQEGQNWEAFQTIAHYSLRNVITIVDMNSFQSDTKVKNIKQICNLQKTLEGLGFCVKKINGHDFKELKKAFVFKKLNKPLVVLARTFKGGLCPVTKTKLSTADGAALWHSKVPSTDEYLKIADYYINIIQNKTIFEKFKSLSAESFFPNPPLLKAPLLSTGHFFAAALDSAMAENKKIIVLDADLAKSCRLEKIKNSYKKRFIELGISEQDMASFAGGLALDGFIPVVNTYASFYKRCFEQLFVNSTENKKIIYAGHYSGIDYHTDGKTHQSINDLNFIRTLPGITAVEPFDKKTSFFYLKWAVNKSEGPVYFKLRRTGFKINLNYKLQGLNPVFVKGSDKMIWTSGPLSLSLILQNPQLKKRSLLIQTVYDNSPDLTFYKRIFKKISEITVFEDNWRNNGLKDYALDLLNRLNINIPLKSVNINKTGWSFRTLKDCADYFDFTVLSEL